MIVYSNHVKLMAHDPSSFFGERWRPFVSHITSLALGKLYQGFIISVKSSLNLGL